MSQSSLKVGIELDREWFLKSRIRLNQILASSKEKLATAPEFYIDSRTIKFVTNFGSMLDAWLEQQNIDRIDYWKELSELPQEHAAEWFSEKWNMWLKPLLGTEPFLLPMNIKLE